MSTRVTGTFEIVTWEEKTYDAQAGTKLTRTHLTKTFHGDVEGTSAAEMLMAYGAVEGSAAYTGFERVTASIHGRSGSFVPTIARPQLAAPCRPRSPSCQTPGRASCAACAARPLSPANRTADTPSHSTTISSNLPGDEQAP